MPGNAVQKPIEVKLIHKIALSTLRVSLKLTSRGKRQMPTLPARCKIQDPIGQANLRAATACNWKHGESEPRSVGAFFQSAHGMAVLMRTALTHLNDSAEASPPAMMPKPGGLPPTLSAPRHGDFPR